MAGMEKQSQTMADGRAQRGGSQSMQEHGQTLANLPCFCHALPMPFPWSQTMGRAWQKHGEGMARWQTDGHTCIARLPTASPK
jgi:hypothetical protein